MPSQTTHAQKQLTLRAYSSPHCRFEFLFEDGTTYKKPTALPAPEYVDALMNWVQSLLDDEDVFPSRIGQLLVRRVA